MLAGTALPASDRQISDPREPLCRSKTERKRRTETDVY